MNHNEEEIRETLLRAQIRTEIRAEWPQQLTTFYNNNVVVTTAIEALAESFVTLAESHRSGLDVTFTIKET